jgi:dihydroflavonol-4-reductase
METIYLVTGATGHLGSAVVKELISGGEQNIRALAMPNDKAIPNLPENVGLTLGDILDVEALNQFFDTPQGFEVIVLHCAGIVSTSMKADRRIFDVNVGGTKNIVDICMKKGVKKLVYVSSIHAMPTLPHGQIMTETETFDPQTVIGPYAKSKAEATAYVKRAAERGLDATIVFPCGIIGPYDYGRSYVTQLIINFCRGGMPMGVRSRFDFVDVRDVAKGIIAAAQKGKSGAGYILGNREVSVPEMFELFHKTTGKRRTRFFAPMWLAKASVPFCALYYKLRRQIPLFNTYSLQTLSCNSCYSHERAANELGYKPRPFEETISDTIAWLKGQGRIK